MTPKTYNVTHLTPKQRRKLFTDCMNKKGFTAFIKNQNKKQTHYTFQYKNSIEAKASSLKRIDFTN